jgi:pimeloyl-ACP methyl ester carboxylesterase
MANRVATETRPTLILLSGLLCDEEIWAEVEQILGAVANVKVLSFTGYSSIESMADHVLASAPAHFALAGHSMGGRVALEVTRRAPSRVIGLALLNTGVHGTAAHEAASRGRLVELARTEGMTALAAEWLPPMLDASRDPMDPLVGRLTRMVERNTPESFSAQIQALLNRPEAESALLSVHVPVLLLSASGDTWSPPRQHAAMRERCPTAQLVILEGGGHMAPVEQPAAVASSLAHWLERVKESLKVEQLTALDRLVIQDACIRQIYKYARLNDRCAWGDLSALFTESAILYRPSKPDVPIEGRQRILECFKARPPQLNRHVVSNVEVTIESPQRAYAVSSIVQYTAAMGDGVGTIASTAVGHFLDQLVKVGDDWLFAERRGAIVMRGSAPTPGNTQ